MKSKNQFNWDLLKQVVIKRFEETDKDVLKEHFAYIDRKTEESDYHKNKYFSRKNKMRWIALGCGIASGILAFGLFEKVEDGVLFWIKVFLALCSIMGPLLIAFYENSQEVEKNRETWLHHRICVNNYINECLEFCAGVNQYAGKNQTEANKLLLEKFVFYREDNNKSFEKSMKC